VKALADAALEALSPTFDAMYSKVGRHSIPPERLLKATPLMAYDTADFVSACRERGITPHAAQTRDKRRRSAVDGRTVRQVDAHVAAVAPSP
jgi:hypothetical protein